MVPLMAQKPSAMRRKPAMQRSTAVLPQPDGPNRAVMPRAGTVKAVSRTKRPSVPRKATSIVPASVIPDPRGTLLDRRHDEDDGECKKHHPGRKNAGFAPLGGFDIVVDRDREDFCLARNVAA